MKTFLIWLAGGALAATAALIALQPGETGTLSCAGNELQITRESDTAVTYNCLVYTPTATPVPTATDIPTATPLPTATALPTATPVVLPTATAMPDMSADMHWHAPSAHGDRPAHEHGDAPPQWLLDAGYDPHFTHDAGTPGENMPYWKHTAFKGWAGKFSDGQDWYGIFHLDFNPAGHVSRFHSYQLWVRDSAGAVSHMHGWLDFGTGLNTGPQLVVTCGVDSGIRPIMLVNQPGCPVRFENWYANASNPGPDVGFNINPNYFAGGDINDPATWTATGGVRNLTRRIEFAYYGNWDGQDRRGEFWTTQFGNVISGPNDPVCGTSVAIGAKSYTFICIKQYIAPTLQAIQFPGNSVQRTFVGAGTVVLPN